MYNQWGEIKFITADGTHRCLANLEKWMANPNIPDNEIRCLGIWRPDLDHTTPEGIKEIWRIGKNFCFLICF